MWSRIALPRPPVVMPLPAGSLFQRVCQIVELDGVGIVNVHLSHGQVLNRRQLRRIAWVLPKRAAVLGDYNLIGPALLPGFDDVGPRHPTHVMGDLVPLRIDRCLVRDLTCLLQRRAAAAAFRPPADRGDAGRGHRAGTAGRRLKIRQQQARRGIAQAHRQRPGDEILEE